jgi:hypothetical protein
LISTSKAYRGSFPFGKRALTMIFPPQRHI